MRFTFSAMIVAALAAVTILVIADKGGLLRHPQPVVTAEAPSPTRSVSTVAQVPASRAATAPASATAPAATPLVPQAATGAATPAATPVAMTHSANAQMVQPAAAPTNTAPATVAAA